MGKRYIKFRRPRGGVPNKDGGRKNCMHCKVPATTTATKVNTGLRMDVWFCDDHAKYAKKLV